MNDFAWRVLAAFIGAPLGIAVVLWVIYRIENRVTEGPSSDDVGSHLRPLTPSEKLAANDPYASYSMPGSIQDCEAWECRRTGAHK